MRVAVPLVEFPKITDEAATVATRLAARLNEPASRQEDKIMGRPYLWVLASLISLVAAACNDSAPTGATPSSSPQPGASAPNPGTTPPTGDVQPLTCDQLEEVSARFSDPGFVDGNDVGLYVSYKGAPGGDKFLKIWWDFVNEPNKVEIVDTQAGDVRRDDDTTFDIEALVEHSYDFDIGTEVTVRVELVLEGTTRGCARNRDVIVGPGGAVVIRRVVSGSTPPDPAQLSFKPVAIGQVERTVVTARVTALGSSTSAQLQVGLTRAGACCPWRAPFAIFPADGVPHTFSWNADLTFSPDGAVIGFRGVESAEFRIEVAFFLRE